MSQPPQEGTSSNPTHQGQKACIHMAAGGPVIIWVNQGQPCPQGSDSSAPLGSGTPSVPHVDPADTIAEAKKKLEDSLNPIKDFTDFLNRVWTKGIGNPDVWKGIGLLALAAFLAVGGLILLGHKPVSGTLNVVTNPASAVKKV